MAIITEEAAWEVVSQYIKDCLEIDRDTLIAVYATGSLPAGYYRPGQSDIDIALVVMNGSERVWGTSEQPSKPLENLSRHYRKEHGIPKDFGPFPLQERDLFPPYDPRNSELPLEIARLKIQGRLVYGKFSLDAVPMPTSKDFMVAAQRFEEWFRDEFLKNTSTEAMSPTACVNTILIHLERFLRIKKGIIEFDKRKVVSIYLESAPPFVNQEALRLLEVFLESATLVEVEVELLRGHVRELRSNMNAYLGITV